MSETPSHRVAAPQPVAAVTTYTEIPAEKNKQDEPQPKKSSKEKE